MKRFALIDFCETIVDHQTFDPFIEYILSHERHTLYHMMCTLGIKAFCEVLTQSFNKLGHEIYFYKRLLVKQTRGLARRRLEELGMSYYIDQIRPHFIPQTMNFINKLKNQGITLVIVSGGCDIYIKHFAEEFGVEYVLAAELEFVNDICTGKLQRECRGSEKTKIIENWVLKEGLEGKFVVGVSDSVNDLEMLSLCERQIVVSRDQHQPWVKGKMEEIIWG